MTDHRTPPARPWRLRRALGILGAAALGWGLLGLGAVLGATLEQPPPAGDAPAGAGGPTERARLSAVIDGDTLRTDRGRVRLIGVDTPEAGECGSAEATRVAAALLPPGTELVLELPAGQNKTDTYDRLLRYVGTAEVADLGLLQLRLGNAVARYDSRDGYPEHPREEAYRAAQTASLGADGRVRGSGCAEKHRPSAGPSPSPTATAGPASLMRRAPGGAQAPMLEHPRAAPGER